MGLLIVQWEIKGMLTMGYPLILHGTLSKDTRMEIIVLVKNLDNECELKLISEKIEI